MAQKSSLKGDSVDNLKFLLNQDIDVPFMVGMVAQARAFIIDRAMLSLIVVFLGAGSISGVMVYRVDQFAEAQVKNDARMVKMMEKINQMALSQNTMGGDVSYMRDDLDKLASSMEKHLDGHPVRLIP